MADRAADQEWCEPAKVLCIVGIAPTTGGRSGGPYDQRTGFAGLRAGARRKSAAGTAATTSAFADPAVTGTEPPVAGSECGDAAARAGVRSGSGQSADSGGVGRLSASLRQSAETVSEFNRTVSVDRY